MQQILTANQIRGRSIGAIFFICFGTGWFFLAITARQLITPITVTGIMLGMVLLLLLALNLFRLSQRWPRVPNDPAVGRAFTWINAIQWTAIAIVVFSFAKLHMDAYITSAIASIIGLHLFPLARIFRYPLHYATGTLLVLWAAASAMLLPAGQMQGATSLGIGVILWSSATVTLALAYQAAKRSGQLVAS
jgi:hypothetical protein